MTSWWNKPSRRRNGPSKSSRPARRTKLSTLWLEDRTVPTVFTNPASIAVPGNAGTGVGPSNPSPSPILVSGLTGQVLTALTVTLNNLSHSAPGDIDALLVAPNGTNIYLFSDAGGTTAIPPGSPVTLTFSATAAGGLGTGPIASGTYLPSNNGVGTGDSDAITNGPGTVASTTFAPFLGIDPNGTWQLYLEDDTAFEIGTVANGWSIDITARVNTPPTANPDSYTTAEDTPLAVTNPANGVLANDTDANGDPITGQLVAVPSLGSVVFNANGTFTYTPVANANGTDTFMYRAFDGIQFGAPTTVTITITAANDGPVAVNDSYLIQNGGPQQFFAGNGLQANDSDGDNTVGFTQNFEGLTLQPFVSPTETGGDGTDWGEIPGGWVRDNGNTPIGNPVEFQGWHAFDIDSWIATEGNQGRSQFTRGGVGARGTILVADGDAYDDGTDVDPLNFITLLDTPAVPLNGVAVNSLKLELDSSFFPENNQIGLIQVTFNGGATWTTIDTLSTALIGGNDNPARVNERISLNVNNPAGAIAAKFRFSYTAGNNWWWAIDNVAVSGTRTAPQTLTATAVTQPANGTLALNANGSFTYTPTSATFVGTDSFTYRLSDGVTNSNTATVTLTVNNNATNPVAVADTFAMAQGGSLAVPFASRILLNDTDADIAGSTAGLRAVLVTAPASGTFALNADGTFTYTPLPAFSGAATFTYKVNDGSRESANGTVTINVALTNVNPPVAVNDAYTLRNNTFVAPVAPGVLANDTDADNSPLTATLVFGVSNGSLTLNADGSFRYQPRPNFIGTDTFTYRAVDANFTSNIATVTFTVTQANIGPIGVPDVYTTPAGTALNVPVATGVLRNDYDDGPLVVLLTENFEGLTLQAFQSPTESGGDGTDWTDSLPAGWTRDNTTTPIGNPVEFQGWHAMDADSWVATEGNQDRSRFTRGGVGAHGTILVADGDAYDDGTDIDTTFMNTLAVTPSVTLGTILQNSLTLEFDSSFRPESPQVGLVEVSFDGGAYTTVLQLDNNTVPGGANSVSRANERVSLNVANPTGAATAQFRFRYQAGNNWWWAIDNVRVTANTPNAGATLTATQIVQPANGTVTVNANGSLLYTPNAGFTGLDTFRYRPSDGTNVGAPTGVSVLVGRQAGVRVDDGTGQRSMVRSLTAYVNGVLGVTGDPATAITLTGPGGAAVPFTFALGTANGLTTVTITPTGPGLIGGSLPDGRYVFTAKANQVTVNGTALDGDGDGTPGGDLVFNFHRYFGDTNGDAAVSGGDFGNFRLAFGTVVGDNGYLDYLDFDGNGSISGGDFGQFRIRFGTMLP